MTAVVMSALAAQSINRLLHHLAGSIIYDATDLEDDVANLAYAVTLATLVPAAVNVDDVLETLAEVGQRHADGGR